MMLSQLGVDHQISGGAVFTFNYLCCSRITHACQRSGELGAISSIMILETHIEMLASIKRAIDARISRNRTLDIRSIF